MGLVHVAVGVICSASGTEVLLSFRHPNSHQGGLWEFPGGKVEPGESLLAALDRELQEELGICTGAVEALVEVRHDYGDKQVLLDVWLVKDFSGDPVGREGQELRWVRLETLSELEFPAANQAIVEALQSRQSLL
ncbi:8-oxo-dGTP diphosphatase MutT [Halieaceae bacterium IMCC14734]|uniref:8-oxo-dGTP diphosphatase n=1 Tax=Candidatus Litorirhabdus singularis TaxID=2518993 RepID=A0ABT3TJA7_9GAMM|nr:8-oxo-dGTP diphosphatase MutT [Candidatus Litorirhabdus singularis]MCX2982393.1 8-oxo-dGTP diphosphatase MutT [Candidatus Litorirhabdus singularis]